MEKTNKKEKVIESKQDEAMNKEDEEKTLKRTNSQAKWLFIIMIGIVVIVFATAWIINESKKFDYVGFTFQKEKFGEIPIFTGQITGYNVKGLPMNFKLVLREDPRSSSIPLEGNLNVRVDSTPYIAINLSSGINDCGDSVSLVSLGQFMSNTGIGIKSAVTTKEESLEYARPLVTCDTSGSTVFILTAGNESKITQDKENPDCYVLSVSNCETQRVIEKLQISILDSINKGEI